VSLEKEVLARIFYLFIYYLWHKSICNICMPDFNVDCKRSWLEILISQQPPAVELKYILPQGGPPTSCVCHKIIRPHAVQPTLGISGVGGGHSD